MSESGTVANPMTSDLQGIDPGLFLAANPVATFAIDLNHVVIHFNPACALTLGVAVGDVMGRRGVGRIFHNHDYAMMVDLIVDGSMKALADDLYQSKYRSSLDIAGAYESEAFFPALGAGGRWLFFTAAALRDEHGKLVGAIETVQDISKRKVVDNALMKAQLEVEQVVEQRTSELAGLNRSLREDVQRREVAERELLERNAELNAVNVKLSAVKEHLIQSEKLASIGQLAAGIAHEINNPIGYIFSNFGTLENYLAQLFDMLATYEKAESLCNAPQTLKELQTKREEIELAFLKEDIPVLMRESKEGIVRVRKIVQDMKDFSHVDTNPDWQFANLNQGIDSTLNVINNEVKYKADLIKDYADLPEVQCMPSEINQVVMNLVVNAAHAIGSERGKITVRTGLSGEQVWLEVIDTGSGIPKEVLPRIFDPFYTTKPIGKGTGLGLSLSYGIVLKHHGSIEVQTEVGKGSTFRVMLPLKQPAATAANSNS
jgi:signal transduction histidine kinase